MEIRADRPEFLACRHWLRPVARWLLRAGVTWKEFAELSREVFVVTASEEFGLRGRPTNVSRVALLTGLSRRDVRSALAEAREASATVAEDALNHASRVLTGWHLDADFLAPDGRPRVLAAEGEAGSFAQLLRRYAGDIPTTALEKELLRSRSVERLADGSYRALRRYYMPHAMDGRAVERAGSVLADLATTVEHNLTREDPEPTRFEGRAQNRRIDPRHLPAFRAYVEREAQALLERMDDWLSTHEAPAAGPAVRLGIGVYAIQDATSGEPR
jgi:hypothetical protein